MFIKQETRDLCDDIINNYQNWKQSDHTINNIKTNKAIWTSNTIFDIDFYPNIKAFNIFEKILIRRSIKKCNILNTINSNVTSDDSDYIEDLKRLIELSNKIENHYKNENRVLKKRIKTLEENKPINDDKDYKALTNELAAAHNIIKNLKKRYQNNE